MSVFRMFRRRHKKPDLSRCPECRKPWFAVKKHPEQAGVLLYLCPKGHAFDDRIAAPVCPS